jgi:hypothetical protein
MRLSPELSDANGTAFDQRGGSVAQKSKKHATLRMTKNGSNETIFRDKGNESELIDTL